MTQDERRQVDRACLTLLGWRKLIWDANIPAWKGLSRHGKQVRYTPFPSSDPSFIVPLAEALRERGHSLDIWGGSSGWRVVIGPENLIEAEADTLPEALAVAAARAVGAPARTAVL